MTWQQLIKLGIEGLLSEINAHGYAGYDVEDMAEEPSLTDEHVFDWLDRNKHDLIEEHVSDDQLDEFCEQIIEVMNSEWYEEQYNTAVQQARQYFEEQTQRRRYEQSHMPQFKPKHNFKY